MPLAFKFRKVVSALPAPESLEPDTLYMVRVGSGFDLYVTDAVAAAKSLNIDTSKISDASPAGIALLTAADAAAQLALLGVGCVKISSGSFSLATAKNIAVPTSGYKRFMLVVNNLAHDGGAATRVRLRLFNGATAQGVRQYTTLYTDYTADGTYGNTAAGKNATLELEGDLCGTYNRGVFVKLATHRAATTTNYPVSSPFGGTADYASVLESTQPIDTIQLSWVSGANIAAQGSWTLYGYL